jgi:DNA-binding MarR family transcriptional regulator
LSDIRQVISLAVDIIQMGQTCISSGLKSRNLGSAEANVLMFLYSNGDGVRQDDIVSGVDVSKAAISRTVRSLQRKGYLLRERSRTDKRAVLVRLTDKARACEGFVHEQYSALFRAAAAGVPVDKVDEIAALFIKVAANMRQYQDSLDK